jgi:hypothetical protein
MHSLTAEKWLSYAIGTLTVVAAGGGLFIEGLYRDSDFIKTAWLTNDLVTLLHIPALPVAIYYHQKGEVRGQLIWLGLMLYIFYNYAFYLFGASFNWFFLLYTSLFTLSLSGLIIGLLHLDLESLRSRSPRSRVRKVVAIFLALIGASLGIVEISECVRYILTGGEPKIPPLILALDISLVIPTCLIAAILLWKNQPWGIVLGTMMLVKSFAYGLVLVSGTIRIALTGVGPWDTLLPFYIFVCAGGVAFGAVLLKNLTGNRPT